MIYGLLTAPSIGALFMAALLPGLLGTALYMAAIARRRGAIPTLGAARARLAAGQRWRRSATSGASRCCLRPVIGGIYLGWFSPTEAAAVGAFGAFLFAQLRRALTPPGCWPSA